MIWASPYWLIGLGIVFLAGIWDWRRNGAEEKNGGRWPKIKQLWANGEGWLDSNSRKSPRRFFWWLALGWLMVALARPQWGKVEQIVFDQSRDVLIALDLSKSMLAEDVKPSRLERGKLLLSSLLADLRGERVGLLVFSGTAFLQSPLSTDYEVLQELMPELSPQLLPQGGTDYGRMIQVALEAFSNDGGADRFLIILSDGESRTENWREDVKQLKGKKIRVIGLGIGTSEGSVIPDNEGGWVKDKSGAVVLSKLGAKTLQALAQETGGLYQQASGWVDIKSLIEKTVNAGQAAEATEKREERQAERFQIFLALAVLCGLISLWREFPVKPRSHGLSEGGHASSWWKVFLRSKGLGLIFATLVLNESSGQISPSNLTNQAASQLPQVIRELSEKKQLSGKDYSRLAEETIGYGKEILARGQKETLEPVIKDALQGVDEGEKADRKAADWEKLRRELEELLKQEQQQQQNQKDQQQQKSESEQQKKDQQNQDQPKNNQAASSQGKDSSSEEKSDSKESQGNKSEKPEEQKKEGSEKRSEKTQKVGGKKEKEVSANAAEAGVQQKLEQVKQKDSPARLFQLMEGGTETNTISNEAEEW